MTTTAMKVDHFAEFRKPIAKPCNQCSCVTAGENLHEIGHRSPSGAVTSLERPFVTHVTGYEESLAGAPNSIPQVTAVTEPPRAPVTSQNHQNLKATKENLDAITELHGLHGQPKSSPLEEARSKNPFLAKAHATAPLAAHLLLRELHAQQTVNSVLIKFEGAKLVTIVASGAPGSFDDLQQELEIDRLAQMDGWRPAWTFGHGF